MVVVYEWDEKKNRLNIEKHGVSFKTASRIFENPVLSEIDDRVDYGEVRKRSIGMIEGVLFLMVVHTDRKGNTRIISARRANRSERQRYEQEIRQRIEH